MKPLQNGNIMNNQDFTILLEEFNPNLSKSLSELETLTKVYPYFQTAHFLYLKSLQNQEKINFNSVLEKTAIITYDRSLLMNWINNKYEFRSKKLESKKEKISNNVKFDEISSPKENKQKTEPTSFNSKKLSFIEWVSISNNLQLNESDHYTDNNWKIINSFLREDPKITQPSKIISDSITDLSSESNFSEKELMTETLAKIFIKQEKYEKAQEAYKILSLKYPEKNALFAVQIKEIKRLINKTGKQ